MGTCVSHNQKELLNELKKHDNNQLILEHLKQNQENFLALTKSLNQIALLNRSEPNLLTIEPPSSPILQSRCQTHFNQDISYCNCKYNPSLTDTTKPSSSKSLLLVALNNRDQQYLEQNKLIKKITSFSEDSVDELNGFTSENYSRYTPDSMQSKSYPKLARKETLASESILRQRSQQQNQLNHKLKHVLATSSKKNFGESSRGSHSTARPFKCRHLSRSPNREMTYTENMISSSLSTSFESIQYASDPKTHNEVYSGYENYPVSNPRLSTSKAHKISESSNVYSDASDLANLHNYGIFCEKSNCEKCKYAMKLIRQSTSHGNRHMQGATYHDSARQNISPTSLTRGRRSQTISPKKHSAANSQSLKSYLADEARIKKCVNFDTQDQSDSTIDDGCMLSQMPSAKLAHVNRPDNGLREYIQRQELKRERIRKASNPKFNNLAIYDNLNEFNNYLNAKLIKKHHINFKKDYNMETMLFSTRNTVQVKEEDNSDYSVLPITIDEGSNFKKKVDTHQEAREIIRESYLSLGKLDLSCSSNEKMGSDSRSLSLESSLNFPNEIPPRATSEEVNDSMTVEQNDVEQSINSEVNKENENDWKSTADTQNSFDFDVKTFEPFDYIVESFDTLNENELKLVPATPTEKLKISTITEAVGFLLFPSSGYINIAFKDILTENSLFELFK
jgi:hypothetical protein